MTKFFVLIFVYTFLATGKVVEYEASNYIETEAKCHEWARINADRVIRDALSVGVSLKVEWRCEERSE